MHHDGTLSQKCDVVSNHTRLLSMFPHFFQTFTPYNCYARPFIGISNPLALDNGSQGYQLQGCVRVQERGEC
jgi:hypothetical protein